MKSWQQSNITRRDARHTKTPDEPVKVSAARKDTKRWCGGKMGRKHKPKCMDYASTKGDSWARQGWKILACTVCGKEIDRWCPVPWYSERRNKPDWVKA